MRKKTLPPVRPTVEDRIAQASALSQNALSIFRQAADDLEVSAQLHEEASDELYEQAEAKRVEAELLDAKSAEVYNAACTAQNNAEKVRSFFG